MFKVRLFSGIVLLAIIISSVVFGNNTLFIFSLFVSLVGLYEFIRLRNVEKTGIAIISYIGAICYCVDYSYLSGKNSMYILLILFLIGAMIYVVCYERIKIDDLVHIAFGFLYVVVLFSFLYKIRELDNILVWLVFISAWGSDTMAYVVGKLIGKHKLTSVLSPKKTIEGSFGGIIGAMLIAYIFIYVFEKINFGVTRAYPSNIYLVVLVVVFFASIFSQIGDLFASAFKRHYKIKDFGNIIPGHGGILDRFDSILFTAPVIYLILTIFLELG